MHPCESFLCNATSVRVWRKIYCKCKKQRDCKRVMGYRMIRKGPGYSNFKKFVGKYSRFIYWWLLVYGSEFMKIPLTFIDSGSLYLPILTAVLLPSSTIPSYIILVSSLPFFFILSIPFHPTPFCHILYHPLHTHSM